MNINQFEKKYIDPVTCLEWNTSILHAKTEYCLLIYKNSIWNSTDVLFWSL